MKKTIFSFMFIMLAACAFVSCGEAKDKTCDAVDTACVDSIDVDSVVVDSANVDSMTIDSVK